MQHVYARTRTDSLGFSSHRGRFNRVQPLQVVDSITLRKLTSFTAVDRTKQ